MVANRIIRILSIRIADPENATWRKPTADEMERLRNAIEVAIDDAGFDAVIKISTRRS